MLKTETSLETSLGTSLETSLETSSRSSQMSRNDDLRAKTIHRPTPSPGYTGSVHHLEVPTV